MCGFVRSNVRGRNSHDNNGEQNHVLDQVQIKRAKLPKTQDSGSPISKLEKVGNRVVSKKDGFRELSLSHWNWRLSTVKHKAENKEFQLPKFRVTDLVPRCVTVEWPWGRPRESCIPFWHASTDQFPTYDSPTSLSTPIGRRKSMYWLLDNLPEACKHFLAAKE